MDKSLPGKYSLWIIRQIIVRVLSKLLPLATVGK